MKESAEAQRVNQLYTLRFTKTPDSTTNCGSGGGAQTVGASRHGLVASLRTTTIEEKEKYDTAYSREIIDLKTATSMPATFPSSVHKTYQDD